MTYEGSNPPLVLNKALMLMRIAFLQSGVQETLAWVQPVHIAVGVILQLHTRFTVFDWH